jgi:hypothetical protein
MMAFLFDNFSDYEFEQLCCDVLKKITGMELRVFPRGRDGGKDITDFHKEHKIVAQAKHMKLSGYSKLKTSLKQWLPRAIELDSEEYYIFCSNDLTDNNLDEPIAK